MLRVIMEFCAVVVMGFYAAGHDGILRCGDDGIVRYGCRPQSGPPTLAICNIASFMTPEGSPKLMITKETKHVTVHKQ